MRPKVFSEFLFIHAERSNKNILKAKDVYNINEPKHSKTQRIKKIPIIVSLQLSNWLPDNDGFVAAQKLVATISCMFKTRINFH